MPEITIKDFGILQSIEAAGGLHPKLWALLRWVHEQWPGRVIITSLYRQDDRGVHGQKPCRGADIRSWVFSYPDAIVAAINDVWDYGDNQHQVALLHDAGRGEHIHLQVRDNTGQRT